MKVKTSELSGAQLDWAVAKCEGHDAHYYGGIVRTTMRGVFGPECHYSTDWAQGGPIIEREWIGLMNQNDEWGAEIAENCSDGYITAVGPTPLVAAMRCYVASKLGHEIDLPVEIRGHEQDCPAMDGFGCKCEEEVK